MTSPFRVRCPHCEQPDPIHHPACRESWSAEISQPTIDPDTVRSIVYGYGDAGSVEPSIPTDSLWPAVVSLIAILAFLAFALWVVFV